MEIRLTRVEGMEPVAVLAVIGNVDAAHYQDLIAKAKEAYDGGLRRMVIDLKGTTYLSSSGLVALHSIALLFRGHEPLDSDQGWASLHAVSSGLGDTPEKNVKLLDPQPNVAKVLERSGMTAYFEVYTDLQKAVEAF